MHPIDDPTLRIGQTQVDSFAWPVAGEFVAPDLIVPSQYSFWEILESRRSERCLKQIELEQIINVVALCLHPRSWKEGDPMKRSRGPAISAGALHPISALIIPAFNDQRLFRYNAAKHIVELLAVDSNVIRIWCSKAKEVLPDACGAYLVLVADSAITESVYENASSLIWRDAGAILQLLGMICRSCSIGYCALGLLGGELSHVISPNGRLVAVGAAAVGSL
jgi:hypothetical protein